MPTPYKILTLGASYGSLLASKLLMAGHTVRLVCLPAEAELMNKEGFRVRMPIKGREGLVEIDSRKLPGKMSAGGTDGVNPADYDLVALAMQEPQYRSPGVRELMSAVAKAKVPCMSIMNMPPLTYLKRISGLNTDPCRAAYTDPTVWDAFDPAFMTLCSPDPQAFRPPEEKVNVLQVRLPTNFKSARFPSDAHTAILRRLEADIEARPVRRARGEDRAPGEAQGARLDLRAARQVGDAARGQLSLRAEGQRAPDQGRGAQRPECVAGRVRVGGHAVRVPRRGPERPRAVREVRQRGVVARQPVLGGARARERRAEHRTRGPSRADHRRAERHAQPGRRRDGRASSTAGWRRTGRRPPEPAGPSRGRTPSAPLARG